MRHVSSLPDPLAIGDYLPPNSTIMAIGYSSIVGKTEVSSIIPDPLTTKVLVIGGQSNHGTHCGTVPYTTVHSTTALNLSIYDGGLYLGADPVLGCSFGGPSSVCMRIADSLITRGKCTRCIVIPVAMGGTPYAVWRPGDQLFDRIQGAILRTRTHGLEVDAFLWGEGEQDASQNTPAATLTANIQAVVQGIRALGCAAPFYPGLFTANGPTINPITRQGIMDSVSSSLNIILGYDADTNLTIAGGYRLSDGTHLSDSGLDKLGTGWSTLGWP